MKLLYEEELKEQTLFRVAQKMLLAARTAPKGRGIDNTVMCVISEKEDIAQLSRKMHEIGEQYQSPAFIRDAENIFSASFIVIFGSKIQSLGLKKCGICGFENCAEKNKHPNIPCAFNTGDLGIAIGSAVSVAMDHRVDNRIMYTIGQAVLELGLLGDSVKIAYGIPLSSGPKNPFFDRKS
ncbi:MAG: ferredoxin [Oligoflexia bacterium]|nr:ferredoxin [Oligoflexia bacterium]